MILKPTYSINGDIVDLDLDMLTRDGVRGMIIDLDSTLMAPKSGAITDDVSDWLEKARIDFKMMVLSNNKRREYLENAEKVLNMTVIGYAAKPFRSKFHTALEVLQLGPEEVVVIGDRPLTDILGGINARMRTVLVRPLRSIEEPSWKTLLRNMERCFIRP